MLHDITSMGQLNNLGIIQGPINVTAVASFLDAFRLVECIFAFPSSHTKRALQLVYRGNCPDKEVDYLLKTK